MTRFHFVVMALFLAEGAHGYEVDTHALITSEAYNRSAMNNPVLKSRYGWDRYLENAPFNIPQMTQAGYSQLAGYFDQVAFAWNAPTLHDGEVRDRMRYERDQMPGGFRGNQGIPSESELRAWLMRGAIREDDLPSDKYGPNEIPPDADPHGEITRVFHHFYDPVHDRGLELPIPCTSLPGSIPAGCVPAANWAFGRAGDTLAAQALPDPNRRNHFTWADARDAMWCGLTYRSADGTPGATPGRIAGARRLCWATSVKALGQVLHLLQDMAQPQHTRNDRHNPPGDQPTWEDAVATDMSRRTYEIWTNFRATRGEVSSPNFEEAQFRSFFGDEIDAPPITLGNYPKPQFATPVAYFTTRHQDANVDARRGLADYSNRNFFSDGTVFSATYPSPPSNPADDSYVETLVSERLHPSHGTVREFEYQRLPVDAVAPGYVDPALIPSVGRLPLARRSLWGDYEVDAPGTMTLEEYTPQADVLIPRAVSYSAGLIDFFYRGTLQVLDPATGMVASLDHGEVHGVDGEGYPRRLDASIFGFTQVRLRVRNTTPTIIESGSGANVPQTASNGELVAIARFHRNPCYTPILGGEVTLNLGFNTLEVPAGCGAAQQRTPFEERAVSAPIDIVGQLDGGAPAALTFDFSGDPIPVNATDLFIDVAYRGQLGQEEDGIAVGGLDVPEPNYLAHMNFSDRYPTGGVWQPTVGAPADQPNAPDLIALLLTTWNQVPMFDLQGPIPAGRYTRVAVIGPQADGAWFSKLTLQFNQTPLSGISDPQARLDYVRQAPAEQSPPEAFVQEPLIRIRGVSSHFMHWVIKQPVDGLGAPPVHLMPPLANPAPVADIVNLD